MEIAACITSTNNIIQNSVLTSIQFSEICYVFYSEYQIISYTNSTKNFTKKQIAHLYCKLTRLCVFYHKNFYTLAKKTFTMNWSYHFYQSMAYGFLFSRVKKDYIG